MIATRETVFKQDTDNKKISVAREFDAPLEKVWRAWTESEILDKWWAPKPFKAVTQSKDLRPGGAWRYYMEGPDGTRHYCRADFTDIVHERSMDVEDAFCDEQGNIVTEFPTMTWKNEFTASGETTKVEIDIFFSSIEDMEKIIEMGFKEGFATAHGNLDELLAGEE